MKKILKLIALATALLLTSACIEDPGYLITNEQTMGDIVDGRFLSDQGLWYDVVEQTCEGSLRELDRAIIICDVLRNTTTSKEYSYDIRLKQFAPVGLPEVVDSYENEKQDPVEVDLAWISGRYLNMRLIYHTVKDSEANHSFKVALVSKPESHKPLVVRVCHDADGEYLGAEGIKEDDLKKAVSFISIPINTYYEDLDYDNIYFEVEFPWHKTADDETTLLPETEIGSIDGKLYL